MKNFKRFLALFLTVILFAGCLGAGVAVSAAPANKVVEAYPGQTVTINYTENCFGLNGRIKYTNSALFSSVTPGTSPYGLITADSFILSSAVKVNCSVTHTVKVKADAAVGSTCDVVFYECDRVDSNNPPSGETGYQTTITVKIVKKLQISQKFQ